MKTNIGKADRAIRIALAIVCVMLCYLQVFDTIRVTVLAGLAAVLVYTGIMGYCPLYNLFSINTRKN